jgi:hypothetical protein
MNDYTACRVCGCTDDNPCTDDDGIPCAWLQPDLCTSCAGQAEPAVRLFSEAEATRIIRAMRAGH